MDRQRIGRSFNFSSFCFGFHVKSSIFANETFIKDKLMKKVFLMLFLAAGASVAMAQSQKVIKGSSSFKATLPEFSYGGKAKIFTFEGDLYGDNKQQTITFYSDDFTKQGELTINPVEYEYYYKHEERAWEGEHTRGYTGDWQVVNEDRGKSYSGIITMYLKDFDQSCDDFRNIYLTQTVFNSNDKYEYLMPVLATENKSHEEDRDGDGNIDVRDTETSAIWTGIQVVSETGTVIQTINFPNGFKSYINSKNDVDLIKINGKLYLSIEGYDSTGDKATLLCSIGTTASGGGDKTRGDVNGDGVVNAADVVKVVDIISGN